MSILVGNGITLTNLASDPVGFPAGATYFNTTYGLVRRFDGANWGDAESSAGFYFVPAAEVVTVALNRFSVAYQHSTTDGRVIINGILQTG